MTLKYKHQASGTFKINSWDEKTWEGKGWNEQSGAKLTHTRVANAYEGELAGEGEAQSLMAYRDDNFATYTGLERITGQLGGRSGSFVFQVNGVYENGSAKTTWTVMPDLGTGELVGLRGEGGYVAHHGDQAVSFTLSYDFE